MDIAMINVDRYENLHSDNGYDLSASTEIYVPFFRCTLKCMCEEQTEMSELDKAVCTCIERGIYLEDEISFVLCLERGILKGELERLKDGGILVEDDEHIPAFTEFGRQCYSRKMKAVNTVIECEVLMNAVTGEWMMPDEDGNDKYVSEAVCRGVCLSPLKTVSKLDIENNDVIRREIGYSKNVTVLRMELSENKKIEYYKEIALLYENDSSKVLFEIFAPLKDELDIALSSSLRKRYEKKEILEFIQAEKQFKSARENIIEASITANNISHPAASIDPENKDIRYLKNREIREMLLKQLDESEKHIFIISPWINDFVVNEDMLNRFENALKRGVVIEIGYGYIPIEKMKWRLKKYREGMADSKKSDKDVTSVEMAKELEKRFSKYEGFSIRYIVNGSHEKFLSYDDAYVYIGSMNLLSYDGGEKENYKGLNFRFEGGILLNDKKFANERMEDFRSLMVPFDE